MHGTIIKWRTLMFYVHHLIWSMMRDKPVAESFQWYYTSELSIIFSPFCNSLKNMNIFDHIKVPWWFWRENHRSSSSGGEKIDYVFFYPTEVMGALNIRSKIKSHTFTSQQESALLFEEVRVLENTTKKILGNPPRERSFQFYLCTYIGWGNDCLRIYCFFRWILYIDSFRDLRKKYFQKFPINSINVCNVSLFFLNKILWKINYLCLIKRKQENIVLEEQEKKRNSITWDNIHLWGGSPKKGSWYLLQFTL